jgi:hypothetical protein
MQFSTFYGRERVQVVMAFPFATQSLRAKNAIYMKWGQLASLASETSISSKIAR